MELTQKLPEVPLVATEEAIQVPSNDHAPQQPLPTQVVPLAPEAPSAPPHTDHTPLPRPPIENHTPLPHPPVANVPMPMYQPPPVMPILRLDDPNLNAEDPSVHLPTMPEMQVNRFSNVTADPRMQPQGVAQPVAQPVNPVLQPVNPVSQSGQNQFATGQGVQMDPHHPQMGQQFGADWQVGQAPGPTHLQSGQPHPQIAQPSTHLQLNYTAQSADSRMGQFQAQPGQTQIVNPATEQGVYPSHPQMGQPQLMHQTNPQPVYSSGQSHPPTGQQTPLPYQPVAQPVHQSNSPQLGQPHPTIVQPAPQLELHNPQITQTVSNTVPANQRMAYGPIPNPPGYDEALILPSQPPPPEPIPPPISLPAPPSNNQSSQLQNQFDGQAQFLNQAASHTAEHYYPGYSQAQTYTTPNQVRPGGNQFPNPVQPVLQPPQSAAGQVGTDASTEKIRELEHQLRLKEESERVRREMEEREKEAILQEKQKWEEEKQREQRQIEQKKQELAEQQAVLVRTKEDLDKMRVQIEEEKKKSLSESEQLRQLLQIQQSGQRDQRAFTVNQGLPVGWEKRLDHTTGRFYYVDHNSKTTHWNPPANWLDYHSQLQQQRREAVFGGQSPGQVPRGGPQISQQPSPNQPLPVGRHANLPLRVAPLPHQVPNQPPALQQQPPIRNVATPTSVASTAHHGQQQAHPSTGHPIAKPVAPSVDRSSKPQVPAGQSSTPSVDRSTKPAMSPAMYQRKLNALQPMYGSSQVGTYREDTLVDMRN